MSSSYQERRQYERVSILAYGQGKTCTLVFDGSRRQADLIDLSAGGARIRLNGAPPPEAKTLVFSVAGVEDKGLLQNLPATVCWRNGQELGIKFEQDLGVGVSTLQKLVG